MMCLWIFFLFFLLKNEDNALNRYDSRDITNLSRKQHCRERWMQNKIVWSNIFQNEKNPAIHNFRPDHSIICWILKNEDKWKKEMKYHTNTRIHGPGTGFFLIFKTLILDWDNYFKTSQNTLSVSQIWPQFDLWGACTYNNSF